MQKRTSAILWPAFVVFAAGAAVAVAPYDVKPAYGTQQVASDPDDPAIWINPKDASQSLILGTNKTPAPSGALVVFGLDGRTRQVIDGIDRPNNVDIEYGLSLGGRRTDIAVLTERLKRRLRVFRINPAEGNVTDIAPNGLPVFDGQTGESGAPMGIALYKRPRDGSIFAVVGRKEGPARGYIWQYRLEDNGSGGVKATKVRELGTFSGKGEIEAIAVDDDLGHVYYADEGDGIHKWHADPDHPQAATELAHFGRDGFRGDREGIAIYTLGKGTGYILCTDQVDGNSEYRVYRREGKPRNPNDHSEVLAVFRGGADSTDGLEATSAAIGSRLPSGLVIAMNSMGRNFLVYDWADIVRGSSSTLKKRQ
jgi:3-phytase